MQRASDAIDLARLLRVTYDRSERLWLVTWDHWGVQDDQPINHQIDEPAREFRYGSGRGRYLVRDRYPYRVGFPENAWVEVREVGEEAHQYAAYHTVEVGPGYLTWAEAQGLAESYNGYPVCVNDEPELGWLEDPARLGGLSTVFWLGARQEAGAPEPGEGWHWVDGRPFDWPTSPPGIGPWAEGEPDDVIGDQDVAHWEPGTGDGCGWYDDNENSPMNCIVIERETVHDDQHLPIYPNEDGNAVWCDYLGDTIWGEYNVNPDTGDATMGRTYLSPCAHLDPGFEPVYYHHNHVGTSRLLSQETAQGHDLFSHVYSAFGQSISEPNPPMARYGYVGAHGYEANLLSFEGAAGTIPITLLHVGERWYDPAAGRFIQRDPIGITAGVNLFSYVLNGPTGTVDPDGLVPPEGVTWPPTTDPPRWPMPKLPPREVAGQIFVFGVACAAFIAPEPWSTLWGAQVLFYEGILLSDLIWGFD